MVFTVTALLLGLALYYSEPLIRSRYVVGGGTTRGAIAAAFLYGRKNEQDCAYDSKCPSCYSCTSCHRSMCDYVCTPLSKLVHCPATGPCSTTVMVFSGPNSVCTRINDINKGKDTCNEMAHGTLYDMYFNCMEDPSSADGTCAVRKWQSSITNNNKDHYSCIKKEKTTPWSENKRGRQTG